MRGATAGGRPCRSSSLPAIRTRFARPGAVDSSGLGSARPFAAQPCGRGGRDGHRLDGPLAPLVAMTGPAAER